MRSDLNIARRMGWRLEWVRALDVDDYDVLIEMLLEEQRNTETTD